MQMLLSGETPKRRWHAVSMDLSRPLRTVDRISMWLALAVVVHYCFFRFFEASTFYFDYTPTVRSITFGAMVFIGVLRLGLGLWTDWRVARNALADGVPEGSSFLEAQAADRRPGFRRDAKRGSELRNDANRKSGFRRDAKRRFGFRADTYVLIKGLLAVLAAVPCIIIADLYGYTFFAYLPFAAYCLYGIDTERVLKVFTASLGTLLLCTVLCALTGAIQNYVYLNDAKGVRSAFGVAFPTDFASYFIYLFVFLWAVQKKHAWWHTALFTALAAGMAVMIQIYPHSDTSTVMSAVCAGVVLWEALDHFVLSRRKGARWASKAGEQIAVWAFPALGVLFLVLMWLYGQGNSFALAVNEKVTERLNYAWQHVVKYGIHALGALTPQNGYGHGLIHTAESYEFLDSTYGLLLIRYGWVLTLMMTALWVWMTRRAFKAGYRRLGLGMAVIALHCFTEHHFPELNFNILLAMPLCIFSHGGRFSVADQPLGTVLGGRKAKISHGGRFSVAEDGTPGTRQPKISHGGRFSVAEEAGKDGGRSEFLRPGWLSGVCGVVVAIGAFLLAPRFFSLLRTLFTLEGWTGGGEQSLPALLITLLWVGLMILVWYALSLLACGWYRERKAPALKMLGLVTVLVGVCTLVCFMDEMMTDGASRAADRLEADSTAAETVLSAAREPVYGGEIEELYKRRFNGRASSGRGFADHMLSDMDLCRGRQGTILLEREKDGYQWLGTGAKYTELSARTALFTYDPAVIAALEAGGYHFDDYYSREREIDLAALSPLNWLGMADSGELMLWGEAHSLIHGPYENLFGGNYEVTFELRLMDPEVYPGMPDRDVCTLFVNALWGEENVRKETVRAEDFGPDGTAAVVLNFSVADVNGVEYLVLCHEDIAVWIRRIAVRRTGK